MGIKHKSIENLDDFKKHLAANSEIKTCKEYLSHRSEQYIDQNLEKGYHALHLQAGLILPHDYIMDPAHKSFKSFLKKYIKLLNKNAPEILFENGHIPGETLPHYKVNILIRVANIPNRDSLPELEALWTDEVAALFKAKMGCHGKPVFPQICFLITKVTMLSTDEPIRLSPTRFFGTKDVRIPKYNLCKMEYSENGTRLDLTIP